MEKALASYSADPAESSASTPARPSVLAATSGTPARGQNLVQLAFECAALAFSSELGLDKLAKIVADGGSLRRTCRIIFDGMTAWSAYYAAASIHVERKIESFGEEWGSVTIGFPDLGEPLPKDSADATAAELSATLIAQALSLRAADLHRSRSGNRDKSALDMLGRIETLLNIGFWEFNPATSSFNWYPGARRLLDIPNRNDGALQRRRNPVIAPLQHRIRDARAPEAFVHAFKIRDDRQELNFEAIGEVRPAHDGPSFGYVRRVEASGDEFLRDPGKDTLTELPNRRALGARLDDAMLKRGASGALILLDVDRFGEVNMIRGSDFGDAFLRAFAKRLQEMAPVDFCARVGSNEFAVLLESMPEEQAVNRARRFAGGIRPLTVFGQEVSGSLSVGVATFPRDGRQPKDILASAALALGAAKARGPNGYVRFAPHLREQAMRDITVRSEVKIGLAEGQFVPFYQPKIDLRSGEIAGFEVLGRWNSRDGLRGPGDFIPALSDPELAREYFTRQLDQTLADVAAWRAEGLKVGRMALNTSSADYVSSDLAEHVLRRLNETGVSADVLGLEITETVILSDMRGIEQTISQLRNAGVEIALDDFGTGYASLTHLRGLPIDVVKIDKSFIDRVAHDPDDRAIVSGIVSIGRALGLKVVAEGIETQEQVNTLKLAECDEGQGYLFGRPMPAHAIPGFLDRERSELNRVVGVQRA